MQKESIAVRRFREKRFERQLDRYLKGKDLSKFEKELLTRNAKRNNYNLTKMVVDKFLSNRKRDSKDDDGRWVTTENGHKVHLSEEGTPDKGNKHVLEAMNNIPSSGKIVVHTSINYLKSRPEYTAAKKEGNLAAAKKIVAECIKPARIKALAEAHPEAVVIPVGSSGSKNRIPLAFALMFQKHGLNVERGVNQIKKSGRTEMGHLERLANRPDYKGKITAGKQYILVDDVSTDGTTLSTLKRYIESKKGKVVAISTLAASKGSTQLEVSKDTINRVYKSHGKKINKLLTDNGLPPIEEMTNREANYIGSMKPETLRHYLVDILEKKKITQNLNYN